MRAPLWQGMWTRARLERVMCLRFGFSRTGGVDIAAAAAGLGVSPRTVRRWLHGSGRSLAHIPQRRLEQIVAVLQPGDELLIREAQKERYARAALSGPTQPAWTAQGWLEPHLVAVVQIRVNDRVRIRQLAITRATSIKGWAEIKRRGRVVDQVQVATRFHATVVCHQVLDSVKPWRFVASPDLVAHSYTQSWTADAPRTQLAAVAAAVQAELPQSPGGTSIDLPSAEGRTSGAPGEEESPDAQAQPS